MAMEEEDGWRTRTAEPLRKMGTVEMGNGETETGEEGGTGGDM